MNRHCPTPVKLRYRSAIAAKLALMKLTVQDKPGHHERRAYRCPCGAWHLTSRPERPRNTTGDAA